MRRRWRVCKSIFNLGDRRIRILRQQLHRGDHHPALAVSALRHLFINPRLLHRMQDFSGLKALLSGPHRGETLDRGDLLSLSIGQRRNAGANLLAIEENGTSPALGHAAAHFRSGELKFMAQDKQQRAFWRGRNNSFRAIYGKSEFGCHVADAAVNPEGLIAVATKYQAGRINTQVAVHRWCPLAFHAGNIKTVMVRARRIAEERFIREIRRP